jgi:hypothetical protein
MCQKTTTCDARGEDAIHEFGVPRVRFEDNFSRNKKERKKITQRLVAIVLFEDMMKFSH